MLIAKDVIDGEKRCSDGDISSLHAFPPAEWRKLLHRYCPEYGMQYSAVRKLSMDNTHAYCCLCNTDFSVGHGGWLDVQEHVPSRLVTALTLPVRWVLLL